MLLIFHYLLFELIDPLLENPRLKKVYRIPVGIVNVIVAYFVITNAGTDALSSYITIAGILLFEFIMFYNDKFMHKVFCMLACLVHVMAMHSLCVSFLALATGSTLYDVMHTPSTLILSLGITCMFLNIAMIAVTKFIPAEKVKIINQSSEHHWFMVTWLSVFSLYFLINSRVYNYNDASPILLESQIAAPLAILLGCYIALLFAFKTSALLGYKYKNRELLKTVEKERFYRTHTEKDVFRVIDINFTTGYLHSGFDDYKEQLGNIVHNYTKMLDFLLKTAVHPEDAWNFTQFGSPHIVIAEFEKGTTEIAFDYRRRMPDGEYAWMRVLMPLRRDEITGDVKGFMQIRNIDAEKREQLALQHKAEIDSLTGLYNKGTTDSLISNCLTPGPGAVSAGVLFIVDIDNFKTINDRLGHLYGDAVLSELSESLRAVFREGDIVGRIGGDEFLAFAKGVVSQDIISKKAADICRAFLRTYSNDKGASYSVSGSIGIAIFPRDGATLEELFKNADTALYAAKGNGKNGYAFYDKTLESSYVSARTEINTHGGLQKKFKDNRVEYVFRLLYGSEDVKLAIESVLELIANNFGFSRANIFEFNEDSSHFSGVFEWCATGVASVMEKYQNLAISDYGFVLSALEASGGLFAATVDEFPEYAQEHYTSIGIRSIVHFSIKERDKLTGVVAFQNCTDMRSNLSAAELGELRTICQVLSVFMVKQRSVEREKRHHKAIETVMDNMNSIAYVVDRENFDVFYENQNVVNITGHSSIGTKCYRSYRGLEAPCGDCALQYLSAENPRCTLELYTEKFDIYTRTDGSLIDWSNDRKAMLLSSVDISEYKRGAG